MHVYKLFFGSCADALVCIPMRSKKKTPEDFAKIRTDVFKLKRQGYSCARIDRKLRVSPGYTSKRLKNPHGKHDGRHFNKGSHKRKVTPAVKLQIKKILDENPPSLQAVRSKLMETAGLSLTIITLKKVAVSLGFKYGTARKVPKLTSAGRAKRVAFCRAHRNTDFKSWIFSDETYISLYEGTKRLWYHPARRPVAEVSAWGPKLMVWVMIRYDRKPVFHIFEKGVTMVSQLYTDTLKEHLLFRGHNAYTFLHDLAKPHTSRHTQQWLAQHHPRVVQNYPACSPDINVIENLFGIVKTQIRAKRPETLEELKQEIKEAFENIPISTVNNLIDSASRRVSDIIAASGAPIKV